PERRSTEVPIPTSRAGISPCGQVTVPDARARPPPAAAHTTASARPANRARLERAITAARAAVIAHPVRTAIDSVAPGSRAKVWAEARIASSGRRIVAGVQSRNFRTEAALSVARP